MTSKRLWVGLALVLIALGLASGLLGGSVGLSASAASAALLTLAVVLDDDATAAEPREDGCSSS